MDDLGIDALAKDFGILFWHGYELLDKLRSTKVADPPLIKEIYEALEANSDFPKTCQQARHIVFLKIFGPKARRSISSLQRMK